MNKSNFMNHEKNSTVPFKMSDLNPRRESRSRFTDKLRGMEASGAFDEAVNRVEEEGSLFVPAIDKNKNENPKNPTLEGTEETDEDVCQISLPEEMTTENSNSSEESEEEGGAKAAGLEYMKNPAKIIPKAESDDEEEERFSSPIGKDLDIMNHPKKSQAILESSGSVKQNYKIDLTFIDSKEKEELVKNEFIKFARMLYDQDFPSDLNLEFKLTSNKTMYKFSEEKEITSENPNNQRSQSKNIDNQKIVNLEESTKHELTSSKLVIEDKKQNNYEIMKKSPLVLQLEKGIIYNGLKNKRLVLRISINTTGFSIEDLLFVFKEPSLIPSKLEVAIIQVLKFQKKFPIYNQLYNLYKPTLMK